MNPNKKYLILIIIITVVLVFILVSITQVDRNPISYSYSFEADWEDWEKKEVDIELGGGEINRSIERSQEMAIDGNTSIKYYMNNLNDAGKIWIDKNFTVNPNKNYEVQVNFYFASKDWGDFNLFRIIASAQATSPQTPEEIVEIHYNLYNKYKEKATTYNSGELDSGYV